MSGFSAEWLSAREPVDHKARSEAVLAGVASWFMNDTALNITDIGSGTGSTLRALKPILPHKLSWHLVDHDDTLLDVAKKEAGQDKVEFSLADLSKSLDALFDKSPDLITTSAFLDLVSADWLNSMVKEITSRKIPFYAALTYDGRAACEPKHETDEKILKAFNTHQKTDKGFGAALGPEAADEAIRLFQEAGYIVATDPSDWVGNSDHKTFQKMLLEGWFGAACEINPASANTFKIWLDERFRLIDEENATLFVGHKDIFAVPA